MVGPSILLESGTNEVELIELYLDQDLEGEVIRRSFGVNVAKVKKIIKQADAKNFSGKKKGNADHRENTIMENPMVMGMYEFMGKVIPLIDLSKWLEMPTLESNKKMVVITEFNNLVSSFLVSGVNRIHRIHWDDISPLDDNMLKFAGDTIIGTVSLDNPKRIMQVLDLERAVADLNPSFACEPVEAIKETFPTEFKAVAADDSLSMRKAVQKALTKGGFEVESYTNGRDAWNHLLDLKSKAEEDHAGIEDYVQIVVTDIEMPMMDGHNLTKRIKEDPVLKVLPVYLFSSLITEDLLHKGQAVGANRQYSKPQIVQLVMDARGDAAELKNS